MKNMKGKRALITGGGTGIGRAICLAFAENGCNVGIHYMSSKDEAERTLADVKKLNVDAILLQGDLTKEVTANKIIESFYGAFEGIDILVNNAGGLVERCPISEMSETLWNAVMEVNIKTAFLSTRATIPYMVNKRAGSIINISSLAGRDGKGSGAAAYCTAKGAIMAFTRALAIELAPYNIRVNCISPGMVLGTHFHARFTPQEVISKVAKTLPLGKHGKPEDIARAAIFLANEADGFLTGITIDINGRFHALDFCNRK